MRQVALDYGDGKMPVQIPDSAIVVRQGETYEDPAPVDPVEATRAALTNPLGTPPLIELAKPGSKVRIAFPDRVKGGAHPTAHRRVAIPLVVEELKKAGVRLQDITLICAVGLHRKNTLEELYWLLGKEIVDQFWPDRLLTHDAENPSGILDLGIDPMGNPVTFSREMAEADLSILIGHVQGNPYGGYSGGYKMSVTGLTSWRSIASHHCPLTMHRDDFLPANASHSLMRKQFDSIGRTIENRIGRQHFVVDAVLGTNSQVLGVYAGAADLVQGESWKLAGQRTDIHLNLKEKIDLLVYGLPRTFHYGPGMGSHPILMLQAISAQLARCYDVFNDGGVIIAPCICDGWMNDAWFGSYAPAFKRLQEVCDLADVARFQEELSTDPEGIYNYRFNNAYHPFHALSMIYMGAIALQRTSAVFIPGAKKGGYARVMGCVPTATFDDAIRRAERYVGKHPRMLVVPDAFTRVGVHLHMS